MNVIDESESRQVVRYTIVAIVGLIAGIVIGGAISGSWHAGAAAATTAVQHPAAPKPSP